MTDDNELGNVVAGERQASAEPGANGADGSEAKPPELLPTLSCYFSDTTATPTAFFKVLRDQKVKRFLEEDQDAAAKIMARLDPEGERLWALMSQSSLPDAVGAWIWLAAQNRLKQRLEHPYEADALDALAVFRSLIASVSPRLRAERREDKRAAETWLRIGICWLVEKRGLKVWQVVSELRSTLFPELASAAAAARKSIQKGKLGELRVAIATAGFAEELVNAANEDRDRERRNARDLHLQLENAQEREEFLRLQLAEAGERISEQEGAIAILESTLTAERQHHGHDLSNAIVKQNVFLRESLSVFLQDAADVLAFDPPEVDPAMRRIQTALAAIRSRLSEGAGDTE